MTSVGSFTDAVNCGDSRDPMRCRALFGATRSAQALSARPLQRVALLKGLRSCRIQHIRAQHVLGANLNHRAFVPGVVQEQQGGSGGR